MTPGSTHLQKPKTAGSTSKPSEIEVSNWRPLNKNTLCGVFDATLPSGLVFRGVMLHQREESRWINFPSREWTNNQGERQFVRIIEFADRAASDKFRDQVLLALDRYLEAVE